MESKPLDFTGLKIPRDYDMVTEERILEALKEIEE